MTPLQQQSNAVLNALDEGAVKTVVLLYEKNAFSPLLYRNGRRDDVINILTDVRFGIKLRKIDAEYWLDFMGVTK